MDPLTELTFAVTANDRDAIARALERVPDVNTRGPHDAAAPLHHAAGEHAVEGVRALLAAGAQVDLPDLYGNTALHYATFDRTDDDDVARLLRAAGADPAGAENRHPDAFDGESVIAAYDDHAIVLNQTVSGLAAFRRPWGETYSPGDADDWEHVFCELPEDLNIPVTHTWQICRLPEGSRGQPVQLSVIRLESLPDAFPTPESPEYVKDGYASLGTVVRLPIARIDHAVMGGDIADLETVAIAYAIRHELATGLD